MPSFDARAAKQLQAGQHLTLDDAPGLRLEATQTSRSWIYRYKSPVSEQMKQVKIGAWPEVPLAQAMGAWADLKAQRAAGRCPATERKQRRIQQADERTAAAAASAVPTVQQLMDGYADWLAGRRAAKGVKEVRRLFATMVPPEVAALRAPEVTRSVAFGLIDGHAATPVVASGLRRELGAAWEWAIDSGRLAEDVPNWWRRVLRGKLRSQGRVLRGERVGVVKRVLQPQEVGALVRFFPHLSRQVADLLTLYLWTACRGAEICAMESSEVTQEADGWWWTIPKAKLKTGHHELTVDHRVPLVGRALAVVRSRLGVIPQGYLFPSRNARALTPHVQQKVVGVAVHWHRVDCELRPEQERPRWPIDHWAPHDLRRTARTELARLGCPNDVAEAILAHLPPGVVGVYNRHTYDAERRHWLSLLDRHWEALAS